MGEIYTWHGNRRGHQVWERLDHFLCNSSFETVFNFAGSSNMDWLFLDHRPIEIKIDIRGRSRPNKRRRAFKYEEYWTRREECAEIIKENGCWEGNDVSVPLLSNNLSRCSKELLKWAININASRKNRIEECKKSLYDNISKCELF